MEAPDDLLMIPDDEFKIIVEVVNPIEVKDTIVTHTVYTLKGTDKQGSFECTRRYRDFDQMRNVLLSHWPGCFIPPLPPKKMVGKNQSTFIECRKRGLNYFCVGLSFLKHLWYSNEFQIFLRNLGDIQKSLKSIPNQNQNQITQKYNQTLINLQNKQVDTAIVAKASQFQVYCRKIKVIIENFKQILQIFIECKNLNNDQSGMLYNYVLNQYEKNCLVTYVHHSNDNQLIFASSKDDRLIALLSQLKQFNSEMDFEEFYFHLDQEYLQLQAFLEALKSRDSIETKIKEMKNQQNSLMLQQQKLNAGKQSIFKSIMKKNVEESKKQVTKNLSNIKEQIQNSSLLSKLITKILGCYEIDRFKRDKVSSYYEVMKKIIKVQFNLATCKQQLFEHVLASQNLN